MSQINELCESIDARIVEANNEIATLQAARAALRDERAAAATSAVSAKVPRTGRRGRAPTSASNDGAAESPKSGGDDGAPDSPNSGSDHGAAESPKSGGDAAVLDPPAEAASKPTVAAPRRRATRRKSASSRRPVEVLLAGKLEAMLGESEAGLSAVTVSKRSNASYRQVLALLRELAQTDRVRRSGTSRTSKWRVVTDEERIAERVAELERLSTGTSAT
jgi:hypothetical protein